MDYNCWQFLIFSVFIDQLGNVILGVMFFFLSLEWGSVVFFVLNNDDLIIYECDGDQYYVYYDLGVFFYLDIVNVEGNLVEYQYIFVLVVVWLKYFLFDDGVMWDIFFVSIGNVVVEQYLMIIEGFCDFYDLVEGGDVGMGYELNFVIGFFYELQMVFCGDYVCILVEFWVDGFDLEIFLGYWFILLNYVNDYFLLVCQFGGEGEVLELLEWDVKCYLVLGGVMYDVVVMVWGIKGWYDYLCLILVLCGMVELG